MDKVISEIVIGGLILSLLFFLIPMYRQSYDLVNNMASKADYSKKIKEVILPDLSDANSASGQEVISLIRYYELKGGATITVYIYSQGLYAYRGDAYDPDVYYIDPLKSFIFQIGFSASQDHIDLYFTSWD